MNYTIKGDKYIFEKNGVYFALTVEQMYDMLETLKQIGQERKDEKVD